MAAPAPSSDTGRSPDEKIPAALALGLGLQLAGLVLPGMVLMPTIVFRSAGQAESVLLWGVSASVVACGATMLLQAVRLGRIGAGYILTTGTSGAAIAVCVAALVAGGPALLAVLMVALALFQFAFSARLALFRRVLTPTVTGTVIMLTPVTVMPVIFDQLENVPAGTAGPAAPLSAFATLAVVVGIVLTAKGPLRLWAPIVGVAAGSAVGAFFGLYDFGRVAAAPWIGVPEAEWPGLDLGFGPAFWALLPAFLFVALICTIQTLSGTLAIQRVSHRPVRAVDFREVQGAVAADGVGNLLSGLAGTMPVGFRPTGASVVELTGVASRRIGIALGAMAIALAFLPKALAAILAIPGPVVAAFVTIMMATVFVIGMRIVVQDGLDYRKAAIAGIAFWIGVGFQNGAIFPEYVAAFADGHLRNGMMAGGLAAIVMTVFSELTKPRRRRIEVAFDNSALETIGAFLRDFAAHGGWGAAMADRLEAVGEETLLTLLDRDGDEARRERRRLLVVARREDDGALLEFVASTEGDNLQDRLALLGEPAADESIEREVSLRLLRHLTSSIRHQQYHDADIVTVRVEAPKPA